MKQTRTLTLDLGPRSYAIAIGDNLLEETGQRLTDLLPGRRTAIVTNETVAPLYLEKTRASLTAAGFQVTPVILPDGEEFKNQRILDTIFDALIGERFERSSSLIALGGGVVGDMTGYAAASLLRGVPFVQIPTTLLSQVDSSVGGKTGINHPLGKNLIGAFYQPKLVLIDLEVLKTLPPEQLLSGLAEVIKYGAIWDAGFWELLENNVDRLLNLDRELYGEVIERCCAIKAEVVAQDEREGGVRALLNLGHTFGHAIETLENYTMLHGLAVGTGMVMAADLSRRLGLCDDESAQRVMDLVKKLGMPVTAPRHPIKEYLAVMARDKKVVAGKTRFVVMDAIGQAHVQGDIPEETLIATLEATMA